MGTLGKKPRWRRREYGRHTRRAAGFCFTIEARAIKHVDREPSLLREVTPSSPAIYSAGHGVVIFFFGAGERAKAFSVLFCEKTPQHTHTHTQHTSVSLCATEAYFTHRRWESLNKLRQRLKKNKQFEYVYYLSLVVAHSGRPNEDSLQTSLSIKVKPET